MNLYVPSTVAKQRERIRLKHSDEKSQKMSCQSFPLRCSQALLLIHAPRHSLKALMVTDNLHFARNVCATKCLLFYLICVHVHISVCMYILCICIIYVYIFNFFPLLGMKTRMSLMLSKCSTPELHPLPNKFLFEVLTAILSVI